MITRDFFIPFSIALCVCCPSGCRRLMGELFIANSDRVSPALWSVSAHTQCDNLQL